MSAAQICNKIDITRPSAELAQLLTNVEKNFPNHKVFQSGFVRIIMLRDERGIENYILRHSSTTVYPQPTQFIIPEPAHLVLKQVSYAQGIFTEEQSQVTLSTLYVAFIETGSYFMAAIHTNASHLMKQVIKMMFLGKVDVQIRADMEDLLVHFPGIQPKYDEARISRAMRFFSDYYGHQALEVRAWLIFARVLYMMFAEAYAAFASIANTLVSCHYFKQLAAILEKPLKSDVNEFMKYLTEQSAAQSSAHPINTADCFAKFRALHPTPKQY